MTFITSPSLVLNTHVSKTLSNIQIHVVQEMRLTTSKHLQHLVNYAANQLLKQSTLTGIFSDFVSHNIQAYVGDLAISPIQELFPSMCPNLI